MSNKKKPAGKRTRKRTAKRSVGAKYRVRHVVEKIGASEMNAATADYLKKLEQQRAWTLLAIDSATSVAAKKKLRKELAQVKAKESAVVGSRKKRR